MKSSMYGIDKIYWLIEDCKRFGTYSFAGLARCGFISIEILNSFVKENILTNQEKINFLENINTITSSLIFDKNNKPKKYFIKKYGHLRPDTYEITSINYKKGYNLYFKNSKNSKASLDIKKFSFTKSIY